MDPNETLRQIRATIGAMRSPDCWPAQRELLLNDLMEQVEALDGWLSSGGFPPEEWREGPDAPRPPELDDILDPVTGQPRDYDQGDNYTGPTFREWED